jgi:hypothetical protein
MAGSPIGGTADQEQTEAGGVADSYPAQGESYPRRLPRPHRPARPGRRRRNLLIALLVLVLVLVAALVVADRFAVGFAERAIATQVSQEIAKQGVKSGPPAVTVNGFPFLTQVLAGRYQSIVIVLRDVESPVPGEQQVVRLPELNINARDITASINTLRTGQGAITAGTVDGTATITYDSVAKLVNQPGLKLREQDGKLQVTTPVKVLGQQFTAQGAADLKVSNGEVTLSFSDVSVDGLPNDPAVRLAVEAFASQLAIPLPLPQLPYKLQVQEVRPLPEGLAVSATAKGVPLKQ